MASAGYRELDDALGLTALAGDVLADSRTGKNGWHGVVGLLRQSVYGRLAGYEDVNDADRLGRDPAMRWIVGGKAVERGGASTSQMGRFETELLANDENLAALADLSGVWIDRVHARNLPRMIVLDMDSSVSPTHGDQEGTAYNGHFGAAPAITRFSCSISSAIWSGAAFVPATCTAPTSGAMCWNRWSLVTATGHSGVYRSGASGASPVPVDDLGLVDDYRSADDGSLHGPGSGGVLCEDRRHDAVVSTLQRLTLSMHECASARSFAWCR